ncbi:hypothetical protein HYX12_03830, partial [Candidatus Woesearchaeota archaeon]|nr:hypothetical protein [Candidatus Woesearchaeota archaeon]
MIHSSRYAHMGEVISINRTSVLVKTTSESGGKLVVKSYRPSDFLREKELHLGLPPVTMDGGYRRSPGHYWEKEAAVLEILTDSQQEGRTVVRVPTFYSKDPEDLTIAMEYLDLPVLSDELAKYESDEDKQPFRERQLQEVGGLQLALNH